MATKKEVILIYGPPGSGKTTIAKYLAKTMKIKYLSVGDITRKEIAAKTNIGKQLKYYLDQVVEYPVDLISSVVEKYLNYKSADDKRFILDGFPKYSWEADRFLRVVTRDNIKISAIVVLNLSLKEALKRIRNRKICQNCQAQILTKSRAKICPKCNSNLIIRKDDKKSAFFRRYNDHIGSIGATLETLKKHINNVIEVDATPSKNQVIKMIENQLCL